MHGLGLTALREAEGPLELLAVITPVAVSEAEEDDGVVAEVSIKLSLNDEEESAATPSLTANGATAAPPLLAVHFKTWQPSCPSHPGYDSDLTIELLPMRILLPGRVIHRLLECVQEVITSVQGAADMLGEQISAAAEAAVT